MGWCMRGLRPRRECVKCIVNVRLDEVIRAVDDEVESIRLQLDLLRRIAGEFEAGDELTITATRIYQWLIQRAPGIIDYYRKVKRESIDEALRVLPSYREYIEGLDGKEAFMHAVSLSIAGNLLDRGVHGHKAPARIDLGIIQSMRYGIDHRDILYDYLREGGRRILWLFDNAGESVYDTILIDLLRSYGNMVVGAAKEEPGFQDDLTIRDAVYAGIDKHLDRLVSTGCNCSSIHQGGVSDEFRRVLESSDIVIAKGMAHYEYISTINLGRPVAFLLVAKCCPVAESLGVGRGSMAAYLRRGG